MEEDPVVASSEILIRKAVRGDGRGIAQVNAQSWRETYAEIVDQEFLDPDVKSVKWEEQISAGFSDRGLFVGTHDKQVRAFIYGGKARNLQRGFDAEIYALYVIEDYQQRGIGSMLVDALCRELQKVHFASMYVEVFTQNSAQAFYKKIGGKEIDTDLLQIGKQELPITVLGWKEFPSMRKRR